MNKNLKYNVMNENRNLKLNSELIFESNRKIKFEQNFSLVTNDQDLEVSGAISYLLAYLVHATTSRLL